MARTKLCGPPCFSPPESPSAARLQVLRIVKRGIADPRDLGGIDLVEIGQVQLATHLAIVPWQIGQRDILADAGPVGDRTGVGPPSQFVDQGFPVSGSMTGSVPTG